MAVMHVGVRHWSVQLHHTLLASVAAAAAAPVCGVIEGCAEVCSLQLVMHGHGAAAFQPYCGFQFTFKN